MSAIQSVFGERKTALEQEPGWYSEEITLEEPLARQFSDDLPGLEAPQPTPATSHLDEPFSRPRPASASQDIHQAISEADQRAGASDIEVTKRPLQQWYGVVTKVAAKTFEAHLVDPTGKELDSNAKIPNELVDQSDLELLQEGAAFYWNVFLEWNRHGQRNTKGYLRFQRIPKFSELDAQLVAKYERLLGDLE